MSRALIPGSFDPITKGHEDIITRASMIFDEVVVCVFENARKTYMFTLADRFEYVKAVTEQYENVIADFSHDMVSEYAEANGCTAIVKGVRSGVNFDDEYSQAMINSALYPAADTVLLPARKELMFVSSTMVRELIKYGADYSLYVPDVVYGLMK